HPCCGGMLKTGKGFRVSGKLENSDFIVASTFWVGVYPGMDRPRLDYMADAITGFVRSKAE
ncbi:MAG: hypothetical protein PHP45_07665, partial [Elusimicrobiales bacterium]|nr:hypothetical protein [Elusimicrobiales bacterium]